MMRKIDTTGPGLPLRLGGTMVVLGFVGMLFWAALAPLDKGVSIQGIVVVSDNRKAVQPLSGGRIASLKVRDGDNVKRGQIVAELDKTPALALRDNLRQQRLQALTRRSRLLAEREERKEVIFDEEDPNSDGYLETLQQAQLLLFHSRRAARDREMEALQATIAGIDAQIAGSNAAMVGYRDQVRSLSQQLQRLRPLAREGYIAANRLLELERQHIQLNGALNQERNNIASLRQRQREQQQLLALRNSEYHKEIDTRWVETEQLIQDLEQRLRAAEYDLQHTAIRSPVDGIVVGMTLHTEGAVVGSGQRLMEIVPQGEPLQIAAQLPVHLVDKVATGAPVELSFSAFNQATTPRISGKVTLVGADQLNDERSGQPYYDLRIWVDDGNIDFLDTFAVRPGMPVEVFIRTGERSLLNYLFKPLFDRFNTALTEE
jgi:protease secretion system membrane fusion protein